MTNRDYLTIAESFNSIQCEGVTTGYPAYFIRLMNCNLNCGATSETLKNIRKLVKEGQTNFDDILVPETGSWVCDSIPVWVGGHKKPFQYLLDKWKVENLVQDIEDRIIHLIWTGGEPTMKVNQECITSFLEWLKEEHCITPYNEIETNGTCYIEEDLFRHLDQINCSAKLSNSGHSHSERIIPFAIERIMQHPNYWFKFVISTEEDILEVFADYIEPFNIPLNKVICMPGLSKQEHFHERTKFVLEMAKKYKFIGMTRLHISAWDQVTGC